MKKLAMLLLLLKCIGSQAVMTPEHSTLRTSDHSNSTPEDKWKVLHTAITTGEVEDISSLVATMDAPTLKKRDTVGNSLFHLALRQDFRGLHEVVKLLVETGHFDINEPDSEGKMAGEILTEQLLPSLAKQLQGRTATRAEVGNIVWQALQENEPLLVLNYLRKTGQAHHSHYLKQAWATFKSCISGLHDILESMQMGGSSLS